MAPWNNLLLPDIDFIKYKYDIWKEENVKHCSYCNKLIKKDNVDFEEYKNIKNYFQKYN